MRMIFRLALLPLFLLSSSAASVAQTRPVFPQTEGLTISYKHCNGDGEYEATCKILLRNVHGDFDNGGLEMAYICRDSEGKPYFDGNNECVMKIERISGQTNIDMDKMSKTMKIMNLIIAGDVSAITVPMKVGETLPDSQIFSTLGIFKATLTISEKKVIDRKTINVGGIDYDCWLVHEKILTKTPFSTDTDIADTWYAEGVGCISQKVYNAKGKLKWTNELISTQIQ